MTTHEAGHDELAEFVIQVAHDIRTPLSAIRGYTDILLKKGDEMSAADRADLLERIRSGAVRMEEQVTEMALRANDLTAD